MQNQCDKLSSVIGGWGGWGRTEHRATNEVAVCDIARGDQKVTPIRVDKYGGIILYVSEFVELCLGEI